MEHRIIDISLLDPNEGQIDGLPSNPRKWSGDDLSRLEDSIRETPELLEARGIIVVPRDGRYVVLGGNMRLAAIRGLGRTEAPCIVLPENTPAEKLREIVIKDNGSFGEWDTTLLSSWWSDLPLDEWGADIDLECTSQSWTKDGLSSKDGSKDEEYSAFEDKFKPKLTTDDCYTPPEVYDVVLKFIRNKIADVKDKDIIRPFRPGGDYENEHYPDGCAVIDNPPFSILSEIVDFYISHNIRFFLFAPTLTLFSNRDCTFIVASAAITYENGAKVNTSFVSNMCGNLRVWLEPTIGKSIKEVQKSKVDELPKYAYPDCLITAAIMGKIVKRGLELKINKSECAYVSNIDYLKDIGKGLYGGGFLLSEKAAAEKAAASRLKLSEREREIIKMLNSKRNKSVERP